MVGARLAQPGLQCAGEGGARGVGAGLNVTKVLFLALLVLCNVVIGMKTVTEAQGEQVSGDDRRGDSYFDAIDVSE